MTMMMMRMIKYDEDDDDIDDIVILRCESCLTTSLESGARLTLAPALSDGYYSHHDHHHYDCQSHHHDHHCDGQSHHHIVVLLTISSSNYNITLLI